MRRVFARGAGDRRDTCNYSRARSAPGEGSVNGDLQPLDLILQNQLASLEVGERESVRSRMTHGILDLVVDRGVPTLKLSQMHFHSHHRKASIGVD